ncbi:Hypothetical predicted protein, partial [Pelobates cultripes]
RLAAWSSVRSTVERGSTANDIVLCAMDVMRSSMERGSEFFFYIRLKRSSRPTNQNEARPKPGSKGFSAVISRLFGGL